MFAILKYVERETIQSYQTFSSFLTAQRVNEF
jgi:hypothetical protein